MVTKSTLYSEERIDVEICCLLLNLESTENINIKV